MKLVARFPTKDSAAVKVLVVRRVRVPLKESVAVENFAVRWLRFPTNEREGVNPASMIFLARIAPVERLAVKLRMARRDRVNAPLKDSVAVNPESRNCFVTAPTKESVAANPLSRIFFVCAATKDKVGVKAFCVCRFMAPENERVAVNALTNKRDTDRLPTKERAAEKPESTSFFVRDAESLNIALRDLKTLAGPRAPTKESAAVKLRGLVLGKKTKIWFGGSGGLLG
jgi:hypothetical protein